MVQKLKTPLVNLLKNLRPFQNYNFKIQWKIHFFTFLNVVRNSSQKKFRIEIWTFSFQICFRNIVFLVFQHFLYIQKVLKYKKFWTSGSGQTENTQIRVFAYFRFDHFPKSKIDSESRFEIRMYIFIF